MRRADRLFQIIQILRRTRRPVTADVIAVEVETSKRTIYRDIADLMAQQVPIRGEAGMGYVLEGGYDLPPLMLTADEVEAAVLGARWVAGRGDPALAQAAMDLIAKITVSVPEKLRPILLDPAVSTKPAWSSVSDGLDVAKVRAWIHAGRKIALLYADEQGRESERVIWPIGVGYLEAVRLLIAWCELRGDFRHFRADRVRHATFLEDRYPERPSVLRTRWRRTVTFQRPSEIEGPCPRA
jgi:predicted DNA-binding transcriptional regulator YafY